MIILLLVLGLILAAPAPAQAYVGPGAGFALLSSFLVIFTTIILAFVAVVSWPVRAVLRLRHRASVRPSIQRLIVVGFDGQDPQLTDRFLKQGKLPNFKKLAADGCYHRLRTTFPSVSPVAWSSFSTGTHPARHNIFDFLDRDRRTYLPKLSSTHIAAPTRFLKLGRFRIPLAKPELRLLRKSKPFWMILGEHRIWSTILRVPITFPPDRFHGAELSAMCVPDLLGTQGTFQLYTTRPSGGRIKEGGIRIPVALEGDTITAAIDGPENVLVEGAPPMKCPLTVRIDRQARRARVEVGGETVTLVPGTLSAWVTLTFRPAPLVKVTGLCRMLLIEMDEHVSLYLTPISLDPENPAMPISHPPYYATYLAKRIGPYATLGLAEDTWALNEGVIDEAAFLRQTYDIDAERQAMFFTALERLRQGSLVCVFDATDRIQHMFWRFLEDGHPARRGRQIDGHDRAIEDLYRRNDEFLGRVMEQLEDDDVLMVLSDHGFASFRRGVNLNSWLHQHGYLALKDGADGSSEWLRDVDWASTRAYALGLTGMFLNLKGREAHGTVEPGAEAASLKAELVKKLSGLQDTENGQIGITEAFDSARLYAGPYIGNAPDLLIGYNRGYRVSWDCATGVIAGPVFEDNVKAWSGDHCIDPRLVPGVFFCSRPIDSDDPALIDIAPTALTLFGVAPPAYMDGKPLMGGTPATPKVAPGARVKVPA
jgi:predicted AlkP superfamily phosphohydrolase/phosphomutase